MDPTTEAAYSSALEPNTDSTSKEICVAGPPDLFSAVGPGPRASVPIKADWAPIMEFIAADILQHPPFGDVLNSLRSLSLSEDSWTDYVRLEGDSDDEENLRPPTTHLIAVVDDLTDMLDFDSDDTDGMDVGAGNDLEPPPTGRWTATSSYDIYTWWTHLRRTTATKRTQRRINPPGQKPKQRRRRRSKSSHSKNSNNNARKIDTPVNSKGNNDHMDPVMEQDEPGHAEHSPEQTPDHSDPEGRTHQPASEEEYSPDDDAFIIPKKRLERDNLHRRLMATARSLKK